MQRVGGLFLPQLIMPGIADSPWKDLPFLRSGWEEVGEVGGAEGEPWLACKMNIKF